MRTNVNKVSTKTDKMPVNMPVTVRVSVDVAADELKGMALFFAMTGMKTSFLEDANNANKGYTLRKLTYALQSGSFKRGLLLDVRRFIEDHKEEVAEWLGED